MHNHLLNFNSQWQGMHLGSAKDFHLVSYTLPEVLNCLVP